MLGQTYITIFPIRVTTGSPTRFIIIVDIFMYIPSIGELASSLTIGHD